MRLTGWIVSLVSGAARQAQGPSMSASPGKIQILGITTIPTSSGPTHVFVLRFLQARNPDWIKEVFFAEYDEKATWFDQLKPAFGAKDFFFEKEYERLRSLEGSSGQMFPLEANVEHRSAIHPIMT